MDCQRHAAFNRSRVGDSALKLSDLIIDAGTGQLSHTKVWANVAYFVTTVSFAWLSYQGKSDADIWLIYLGIVASHAAASKVVSLKFGGKE